MNKFFLKLFVGAIALSLAVCAGFFSIVGLAKLFAGASAAVIAMATTLEASKLIVASFLYQYWTSVSKILRFYLLVAISVIAMITSIGIYGFLSGAYQNTKSKFDLTQTQADSLLAQQTYYEGSVNSYKLQLDSKTKQLSNLTSIRNAQELRATELVNQKRSSRAADRSATETDLNIKTINQEIDILNDKIILYSDSASKMKVAITKLKLNNELSSELGSLVYISNMTGYPMDKIVNILIVLFIIVFDPLAICMVLAFNFLNRNEVPKQDIDSIGLDYDYDYNVETTMQAENIESINTEPPQEQTITETENIDIQNSDQTVIEEKKPESIKRNKADKAKKLYSGGVSF